ncbi:hypothetical protein WJX74_005339 [Apatococcus lobatus]|uniref:Dirigent protein n=2 Tax=Apatococcus TaxID=904362 RepID=A0AAW1T644_9CHLO
MSLIAGTSAASEKMVLLVYIASTATLPANISIGAAVGQTYITNFFVTDYQTNATLGTELGFCTGLQPQGASQCLNTITFATGTVQVSGLTYPPGGQFTNPITDGVLAVTGGTGLYTGAKGYYQEFAVPHTGPHPPANGVILAIDY